MKIGSSKSARTAPLNITYGVPQGSILSPLLFSIYTNDLPSITTESLLDSYVDDSKISLSFSIQDKLEAKRVLEEDLNNVARWCCANSPLLNPDKTKFLLLGTLQLLSVFSEGITLNFLGKRLHPISTAKDLPILVNWFHHVYLNSATLTEYVIF